MSFEKKVMGNPEIAVSFLAVAILEKSFFNVLSASKSDCRFR
jgi:hypothetical protein